jgi:hypothetical protein
MPPRKNRSTTAKGSPKAKTSQKTRAAPKKRKTTAPDDENETKGVRPAKRTRTTKGTGSDNDDSTARRQAETSTTSTNELEKPVIINRAPVLELWGACVARFLHPELSWGLCLSIGSSISTITAISKGRSIGTIAPPDPTKKEEERGAGNQDKKGDEISVMGFPMTIKGDSVLVKGKPKTAREVNLVRKYGSDETYGKVKDTMTEALEDWKGKEADLDAEAFHMYEKFRPAVAKGQKGWGRKGELHLSKVRDTIRK